jgi:uncharacterized protein YjbI with pentapeptide repeats
MWKPPDSLRQRWVEDEFRLEFIGMSALGAGKPAAAGLPIHNGRIDFRAFDTPPGGPSTSGGLGDRVKRAFGALPRDWSSLKSIRLDKVDFTHARLSHLIFEDVEITDCVFDRTVLESARFGRCSFRDCSFVRADLGGARLGDFWNPNRFLPSEFRGCNFSNADMTDTDVLGSRFERCDFRHARMGHSEWAGAVLHDCSFAGEIREARFEATGRINRVPARPEMLDSVDLSNTQLRWVEFDGLNLNGTVFPNDGNHLVVRDSRCFAQAVLDELGASDTTPARFARSVLPRRVRRLGPAQAAELFNLKDWCGNWDESGNAEMRRAFDAALKKCHEQLLERAV